MNHFKNISDLIKFSGEKMQKNGVFETPRMFCDVYCFEPGQEQRIHSHGGSDKIYFVLDGRGTFQIGDERREVGPREIAIAPSGVNHGVRNDSSGRLSLLVFMAPKPTH